MCESPTIKGRTGWRGWMSLPSKTARKGDENWIDLTHPFSPSVPRSALFPPPRFSYFAQMPERPLNVTHMETIVHMGTHVDAPRHFYADGPGMDEIPLERMMGEGVVIHLDKSVNDEIGVDDLVAAKPTIEPGDVVAIDTGWSARWGAPEWNQHPYLSLKLLNGWSTIKLSSSQSIPRRLIFPSTSAPRIFHSRYTVCFSKRAF